MRARAALAAAIALAILAVVAVAQGLRGSGAAPSEIGALRAQIEEERQARERLEAQLARLEADLARLRKAGSVIDEATAAASVGAAPGAAADAGEDAAIADDAASVSPPGHAWFDSRRLTGAGLAERDVGDLQRFFDEIELERLYLQNQASREGWPNGRLATEMAALDERTAALRTAYGDETYDWFLYAAGRPNRVVVEGVIGGSAAADAGLRSGDVILSYDRERVFRPGPLIQGTLRGRLQDDVEVEVLRGGERIEVTLPRGPLGIRLGRQTATPEPIRR